MKRSWLAARGANRRNCNFATYGSTHPRWTSQTPKERTYLEKDLNCLAEPMLQARTKHRFWRHSLAWLGKCHDGGLHGPVAAGTGYEKLEGDRPRQRYTATQARRTPASSQLPVNTTARSRASMQANWKMHLRKSFFTCSSTTVCKEIISVASLKACIAPFFKSSASADA